ncbi:MAG: type IV toxin-antitoxin system AbiEi family antitoxin domain-containing protein [Candidatus Hydrothermarchaeota archaeon]
MIKLEQLYKELLTRKVVTSNEITKLAASIIDARVTNEYVHKEYIQKLLERGKLVRLRKGLYAALTPLETSESFVPDKFLVASKIRSRYYLGYHTALEFHGCAYSSYNQGYICVRKKDRFDAFEYKNLSFKPVFTKDIETGVEKRSYLNHEIRVSSPERTFVDCLDKPGYAGGWEELLKSFEGLSGLNFENIYQILRKFDKDLLYRKVGLVLEMMREHSVYYENLSDKTLGKIKNHLGKTPLYLEKGKSSSFNENWNLYVPKDFKEYLRGV